MDRLLEIQYLPCIQYCSKLIQEGRTVIDDQEPFTRQSYRNRCYIAAANGVIPLIVPVYDARGQQPITEVKIDNTKPWQRLHWQSLQSAYGKSPFFEYYRDRLQELYKTAFKYLFEFDLALLRLLMHWLKIGEEKVILLSAAGSSEQEVLKDSIHPKKSYAEDTAYVSVPYMQVFEDRYGFQPNLSILDLLFNEGPAARDILLASIR